MAEGGVEELEPQLLVSKPLREEIACRKPRAALPFVCMNNSDFVVVFYEFDNNIYHVVGRINKGSENKAQLKMDWGREGDYGDGCKVQACLTDNNVIVLVRERKWRRECVYSTGTIADNLTINWKRKDQFLCKGTNPTMAVTGDTVLFLHEANSVVHRSVYNVFSLNEDRTLTQRGQPNSTVSGLNGYTQLSVAVNGNGDLIICCRLAYTFSLCYAVGKLEGNTLSGLNNVMEYSSGSRPHVCLLDSGKVIEVHRIKLGLRLYYQSGNLQPDQGSIEWFRSHHYDYGCYPCIAVNDGHTLVEFHTALKVSSQLWYRLGTGLLV